MKDEAFGRMEVGPIFTTKCIIVREGGAGGGNTEPSGNQGKSTKSCEK